MFDFSDLQSQLDSQQTNVTVVPGIYNLSKGVTVSRSGIFDFTAVTLMGLAKAGTLLSINANETKIIAPTFDSIFPATKGIGLNPIVGVSGLIFNGRFCVLDRLRFRNIDTGIRFYPHSHFLTLLAPRFEPLECRGDNLYCGGLDESIERGDIYWIGGYGNSEQEHCIRASTIGMSGLWAEGVTFNAFAGKECVAPRECSDFTFSGCAFNGPMATFVGNKSGDVNRCRNIQFLRNKFFGNCIDARAVKGLDVIDNDFWPDSRGTSPQIVTGSDNSSQNVFISNNRRHYSDPLWRKKPIFQIVSPLFIDGGGNTDILIP